MIQSKSRLEILQNIIIREKCICLIMNCYTITSEMIVSKEIGLQSEGTVFFPYVVNRFQFCNFASIRENQTVIKSQLLLVKSVWKAYLYQQPSRFQFFKIIFYSFMTEAVIIQKPVQSMNWFLYDNGLHHGRVKTLSLSIVQTKIICNWNNNL